MTITEMRDAQAVPLKTPRGALTLALLLRVQLLDLLDDVGTGFVLAAAAIAATAANQRPSKSSVGATS
jgi:hypothetical protein